MITEVLQGNILDSQCQTLVNTVNTVGIMGKGVALEFKRRFPEMFKDYVRRCEVGEVVLGRPYLHRSLVPPWIINFPTKEHWRSVSRLDAIVDGLEYLSDHIEEWEVESLAVPPLGCGNGQLEWSVVGPTLFRWLEQLPIPVELYAPHEAPKEQLGREFLAFPGERSISADESRLEASWIALAAIVGKLDEARDLVAHRAHSLAEAGLLRHRGRRAYAPGVRRTTLRPFRGRAHRHPFEACQQWNSR